VENVRERGRVSRQQRFRFIAILLVIFGLTVEQSLEDFVELSAVVFEVQGVDADARTMALKVYVSTLMKKHSIPDGMRLMDPNDRSKGCKLYVFVVLSNRVASDPF
jgi:hypothetical protein